jgi:protein-disulfide isomerase
MLLLPILAGADNHSRVSEEGLDEEALADRVAEKVMQELKQSEFLQQQIESGIKAFIRKQREAQTQARAEQGRDANRRAGSIRRVSADRDHIYGNPDARISLVEYSDFECPFCKRFHPTAKEAIEAYDGEVNWVYRHFPLAFHNPLALKEAEASECAGSLGGNEGFWRYADAVYERTRSNGNGFPIDGLVPLAAELGFDEPRFQECLESGRFTRRVNADLEEGQAIGISGTPGNVLLDNRTGEVRVVSGAVPLQRLKAEIDALLSSP